MTLLNFPPTSGVYAAHTIALLVLAWLVQRAAAQAPGNDVISWPPGLLLLATVVYAALSRTGQQLWYIEPAVGLFHLRICGGQPLFNLGAWYNCTWRSGTYHFMPLPSPALGTNALWYPVTLLPQPACARALAVLRNTIPSINCGATNPPPALARTQWTTNLHGLLEVRTGAVVPARADAGGAIREPTARDYLLFAAMGSDLKPAVDTSVSSSDNNALIFSTHDYPHGAVFSVTNIEITRVVLAAILVRHRLIPDVNVTHLSDGMFEDWRPWRGAVEVPDATTPIPVTATFGELIRAYLAVVNSIRGGSPAHVVGENHGYARIHVNGALWLALLGGCLLGTGRLTIHLQPERRRLSIPVEPRRAYEAMAMHVNDSLRAVGRNATAFDEVSSPAGRLPHQATVFLVSGLCCQAAVCFFLSIGTSAGIWTSVAMANSLAAGRFHDLHPTMYNRRTGEYDLSMQPGYKLFIPGTRNILAVATVPATQPPHGPLRPGFLLNLFGIVAAIFGSIGIFRTAVRQGLGFGDFEPSPPWVLYSTVGISLAASVSLIYVWLSRYSIHQVYPGPEAEDYEVAILVVSTVCGSFSMCGLALYFQLTGRGHLWPILDALAFVSGFPLGMIGNGLMPYGSSHEDVILHLVLLNRWVMGAIASSLGSGVKA